ncbi:UPF0489 protein C5orf22 [Sergentomyia squamirostris]
MDKKLRNFEKIPIFIVEDHNDVLQFIYRCLGSRHLPFEGNTLVHFDAHPDLTVPGKVPTTDVYDKEKLLAALSIENWIMPMCYAGHVGEILWIRQSWAQQIPPGRHDFIVGEDVGKRMRVVSDLEYFVSEGSLGHRDNLKNRKEVKFHVGNSREILESEVRPKNYILDIDLDYFSTHNPFRTLHEEINLYEKLRGIYSYHLDGRDLFGTSKRREEQLEFLERIFTHLEEKKNLEDFNEKTHKLYQDVENLVREVEEAGIRSIDWEIIHAAGCTLDSTPLPHHESTAEELQGALGEFREFLRKFPPPTIVTISRSSEDDYCPQHQVDFIEKSVLDILREVYEDTLTDNPTYYYRNTSPDDSVL